MRVATAQSHLQLAEQDVSKLDLRAGTDGYFVLRQPVKIGQYLPAGHSIGQLLPEAAALVLTGTFSERSVTAFKRGVADVTLWDGSHYTSLPVGSAHLAEQPRMDKADMSRGFTLRLVLSPDPAGDTPRIVAFAPQVRLRFVPVPVWMHLADWASGLISRFRDAEISERQQRIETP